MTDHIARLDADLAEIAARLQPSRPGRLLTLAIALIGLFGARAFARLHGGV